MFRALICDVRAFGLALAALAVLSATFAGAAPVTGRGQEFWAAWPRSHLSLETSAELIVMADAPTVVEIDGAFTAGPALVSPGSPWVVLLPDNLRMAAERTVLQTGFRVRSLDPASDIIVTFRVPSQAEASDDMARLLPVSELGTRYLVTSYPASLPGEPSLYAIVATEDGTTVDAASPCLGTTDRITLDRGQAWQVFCDWRSMPADVTGAEVSADRPIAVFHGNSDTFIPSNYLSGDFIIEQAAPVESWGTEFYACPFPKGPLATPAAHDVVRVVASRAGTLTVDAGAGTWTAALAGTGAFVELDLLVPLRLTSDVPIDVHQFATGFELSDLGDPFMAQVPATSQWGAGARAWIPAYYQLGNHLTLVTATAATGSASVDGAPVTGWQALPGGTHSWTRVDLGTLPGERLVACGAPIGVLAYGFNDIYLPNPGLGRTPGSHGTVAAHFVPPCSVLASASPPASACAGQVLTLRNDGSSAVGCTALEYRWLADGLPIPGCGFSPLGTCVVTFSDEADYTLEARCVATPACTAVATFRVALEPVVQLALSPDPATTCAGQSLEILAPPGFLEYAWTSDVADPGVTPRTSASPSLLASPEEDTSYTVSARDARGCPATGSLRVTVLPDPLPPALDASVRVVRVGTDDTVISWSDLPSPWRGYEVVVLECAGLELLAGCAGRSPDPVTIQAAPLVAPAVPPGTGRQVHAGALLLGDLLCYKVRATSLCAGTPGPTCNPWPAQRVTCP